jgi:transposase-like protein
MNNLETEKQEPLIAALVEGNSIRSTERMVGVHRDTIMRILVDVSED